MKKIYKKVDTAFSELDFSGKGMVAESDFFQTLIMYKLPYSKPQVKEFFDRENIFKGQPNEMLSMPKFSKVFFPEEGPMVIKEVVRVTNEPKTEVILQKLKRTELVLKQKLAANWQSVRKAFLDLDQDYDGFITAQDIGRYFGQDGSKLDFADLQMLIKYKDSKKVGTLNYKDFSKWMGSSIEPSEGFYFRHDSVRNPQYHLNLEKQAKSTVLKSQKKVQEDLTAQNFIKQFISKVQHQWKTLKKAFSDLNVNKQGMIEKPELEYYLMHWGFKTNPELVDNLFNTLDVDRDGKISYVDFQNSVGKEISPPEFLYF